MALAPVQKDELTPPREGWERPPELLGYLPVADFQHRGRTNWTDGRFSCTHLTEFLDYELFGL